MEIIKSVHAAAIKKQRSLFFFTASILILLLLITSFISVKNTVEAEGSLVFISNEPKHGIESKRFVVLVGEVNSPGIYEIKSEERYFELIKRAGDFTEFADLNEFSKQLDLAKQLTDGETISVPSLVIKNTDNQTSKASGLVNINTSPKAQLENLPGIGPSTAQKIIDNRSYLEIEDLLDVPGIGEKTLEEISELISI